MDCFLLCVSVLHSECQVNHLLVYSHIHSCYSLVSLLNNHSFVGDLVAIPGSCLIIYLLYSMGSIYKYISYMIIPCVLLEGIYCIVMLVAWCKWCRIPRHLRGKKHVISVILEYAYLYRKAIPIVK